MLTHQGPRRSPPRRASSPLRTLALAAVLTLVAASTGRAQFGIPQVVFDPTAVAKLASQLRQQIDQINVARSQLRSQLDNMRKLGTYTFRDVSAVLDQVDALTREGQALSYSLRTIDRDFRATFPGAQLGTRMARDIRTQNERTLATLGAMLTASRASAQQFARGTAQLEAMKSQLRSVTSLQQAGELNGAVSIHSAQELTLLRQQLATIGSAQTVYMANQVNRDLQGAAAAEAFWRPGQSTPVRRKNMSVAAVGFQP